MLNVYNLSRGVKSFTEVNLNFARLLLFSLSLPIKFLSVIMVCLSLIRFFSVIMLIPEKNL